MDETNPLTKVPLRDVEEPRCACVLLLDVSGSMTTDDRIGKLNRALKIFANEVASDPLAAKRVEAAVVSFGSDVRIETDFVQAREFRPVELSIRGATSMGKAVLTALDMVKQRKDIYKANGVDYYRPWIFLITDGSPTDHNTADWNNAVKGVHEGELGKALAFFAVGVTGANFETLSELSKTPPLELKGLMFRELFQWLSKSMQTISGSQPEDTTPLDDFSAWGQMPTR